jgi:hypothetical protein
MKKIFQFLAIFLTISLLSSCHALNSNFTRIEGKVVDMGSGKGIAGATVVIYECVSGGLGGGRFCEPIDSVFTDKDGNYKYENATSDASSFDLRAFKKNHTLDVSIGATTGEKHKNKNLSLKAHAWIKFHVKNVNPFNEYDKIIAPGAFGGGVNYVFYGKNIDTTYILGGNEYGGNKKNHISWFINKNNTVNKNLDYHSDSLFCKGLDTTFYEVKY